MAVSLGNRTEMERALREAVAGAENGIVALSSPHLLYRTNEQAKAYERATRNSPEYYEELDKPVSDLIINNIDELCDSLVDRIYFIDLGPGYPSKSLFILDALLKKGHSLTYYPVDISPFFLDRAASAVVSRGVNYKPILERFEDLAPVLDETLFQIGGVRYAFLGLTFNNFEPVYILNILSDLFKSRDRCVICSQSPANKSKEDLLNPYRTSAVDRFCFQPLKNMGLSRSDFTFNVAFRDSAIRVGYKAISNLRVNDLVIKKGVILETSASFRYDDEYVSDIIKNQFIIRSCHKDENRGLTLFHLEGK